jgi:hypothetical protein
MTDKYPNFKIKLESAQTSQAPLSPEEEDDEDLQELNLQMTSAIETDQPTSCCLGDIAETEFQRQADGNVKCGKVARPGSRQLLSFPRPLRGRKKKRGLKKESVETRRERKAWRTLAIITVQINGQNM